MERYVRMYSRKEEAWNIASHGFGLLLSVGGLVLLIVFASMFKSVWHVVSFSIYGSSLVILYAASTIYHSSIKPKLRHRLNVFDHASIYVLIAGTYTPYVLVTLNGPWGWSLFGVIWGLAIAGVILKLFFAGQYDKLSTWAYVLMGWLVVVAIYPLVMNLSTGGLVLLLVGGVLYTAGAVFYLWNKLNFNHAIFHFFVLGGSIAHFFSIFFFV